MRATSDASNLRFDASSTQLTLSLRGGSDSRFELSVPIGVRVVAHTRSGDVSVRGTHGEVEVRTQSGDIRLEDVAKRLDVNTFSGDITGQAAGRRRRHRDDERRYEDSTTCAATSTIETVSGDVGLRGVTAKLVRAKTTSGDVVFDGIDRSAGALRALDSTLATSASTCRATRTHSSPSRPGTAASTAQFPITLTPGEHGIGVATAKRFTFQVGGGAARITAETFSGDITISSNGRGASAVKP